ncbi:hypothetical protein GUJ93_ZPchr0008g12908 [Zizania palustris]|uniref:Pentatricopeptide repeat-containing protein n=1 Tax=Zizania palustris TaxID=103762 RepID=A0A8J5RBJ4_ZIZPA|nr:hypothetical protein GUJ93_ZPchr0008g12908 [Zizania palustris]
MLGLEHDVYTGNSLVAFYAKLDLVKNAEMVFDGMPVRYIVTWNMMMDGYVANRLGACSTGLLPAVMHMYARSDDVVGTREIFDKMVSKDVISWNTMIMGYAIHGQGYTALEMFDEMKYNGLQPNESTFVSVLTACSVSGLVDEGWMHFNLMLKDYGMIPHIEHYGCMTDLLGQEGDLREVLQFIENMPIAPTLRIWGSLLTASRNKNDIDIIERWGDVERVRSLMNEKGLQKMDARILVELYGMAYSFVNGDMSHLQSTTIHEVCDNNFSDELSSFVGELGNLTQQIPKNAGLSGRIPKELVNCFEYSLRRSGSEVLRHLRTQASERQKFEVKKTSLHLQPSKTYSAKSVQAPHTRCFEQASHFTLRKSGQPSEDYDQVLGDSNGCWASYPKVYTHTQMDYAKGFDTKSTTGQNRASLVISEVLPRVTQSDSTL